MPPPRNGLDRLIDAVVSCLRCHTKGPPGTCDCLIRLICPTCRRAIWVERDSSIDPAGAAMLHANCLACEPPGPREVTYFNQAGREVPI